MCQDYSERLDNIEHGLKELGLKKCDSCGTWTKRVKSIVLEYSKSSQEWCTYCLKWKGNYIVKKK